MEIIKNSIVSFGSSRKNEYTANQVKIMRDMKKAAINYHWCDIYSGNEFSRENLPTIEHLVPCSIRNNSAVKQLTTSGFQINGLDNIFPVGSLGNSTRKSERFKKTVLDAPVILERLLSELNKYSKYKSDFIDGQNWVNRLTETLLRELSGISSDIKTRKLI